MKVTLRRHGIVIRTIDVLKSPARIGSGEECEIRIDDPYLAGHVGDLVERDGEWFMVDAAASLEGITRDGRRIDDEPVAWKEPYSVGGFEVVADDGIQRPPTLSGAPTVAGNVPRPPTVPGTVIEQLPTRPTTIPGTVVEDIERGPRRGHERHEEQGRDAGTIRTRRPSSSHPSGDAPAPGALPSTGADAAACSGKIKTPSPGHRSPGSGAGSASPGGGGFQDGRRETEAGRSSGCGSGRCSGGRTGPAGGTDRRRPGRLAECRCSS